MEQAYEADRTVSVEVEVQEAHQGKQMAHMERGRRGIDAGIDDYFLRIHKRRELSGGPVQQSGGKNSRLI